MKDYSGMRKQVEKIQELCGSVLSMMDGTEMEANQKDYTASMEDDESEMEDGSDDKDTKKSLAVAMLRKKFA